MIKIGQKYRETKNCLGEPVKANLTILDGPRIVEKRREWYCRRFFIEEVTSKITGETIYLRTAHCYWLGEDYLENKIEKRRMYLKIFKNKEGKK